MTPTTGNETDCFHVLQAPQPTSLDDPFVGNETVDDNLTECVQVAVWNAAHGRCHDLAVSVVQGHVTLSGAVETAQHAQDCEAAVRALPGVLQVANNLVPGDRPRSGMGAAPRRDAVRLSTAAPLPGVAATPSAI